MNQNEKEEARRNYSANVARALAGEYPPSCNTGDTYHVTRGGTSSPKPAQRAKTIVDTISWSVYASVEEQVEAAKQLGIFVLGQFPPGCTWGDREDGTKGFASQRQLLSGSIVLGWLAYGAYHGRMWLYLTGAGLRLRRDYGLEDRDLLSISLLIGARLGRCDIALDIYSHAEFSVEKSLKAHVQGLYTLPKSPNAPWQSVMESDTNNEDFPKARTHYLGRPKSPKRLRVYDKGLQLLGRMTPEDLETYRDNGIISSADVPKDSRLEEWTRVELVSMHDKQRPLDNAMLLDPDSYFAGSYPQLQILLDGHEGKRPAYLPKEEECELARMIMAAKESYGGLLYFMRHHRHMNDKEIVKLIMGPKKAARLKVDKERPSGHE